MNKTLLMILDGYGINPNTKGNAIQAAKTPNLDYYQNKYPLARLKTSGKSVGLPDGIMGNSETGHLNIGAGRVVYQLNTLIDSKIESGEFFENEALLKAINLAKEINRYVHIMGLISDGGVHSSLKHLYALIRLCKQENFSNVFIHCFMDGRDTLPNSGIGFVNDLIAYLEEQKTGRIGSIMGRFYAMDRDNRWERVERAWNALVNGIGEQNADPINAIQNSYDKDITDEFIEPIVICENKQAIAKIKDNDSIIFFNFRSDRARELTSSFIYQDFKEFDAKYLNKLCYVGMVEYDIRFNDYVPVAFRNQVLTNILGEVFEKNKVKQLRLAETEKYAHVTFFFNGGVEKAYQGEDRILVPSPKVASYDMQPEMHALIVKDECIKAIKSDKYQSIIMNFANCDMVGHTGVFDATVKAVETVDQCVGDIIPLALEKGFSVIITADHGNAEQMFDEEGNVMTAHSLNDVPICVVSNDNSIKSIDSGILADIAPTLLELMDIEQPQEMTGKSLINKS